jgi:hypothetical protein
VIVRTGNHEFRWMEHDVGVCLHCGCSLEEVVDGIALTCAPRRPDFARAERICIGAAATVSSLGLAMMLSAPQFAMPAAGFALAYASLWGIALTGTMPRRT